MKKIALKYGLMITIGAAAWVILAHQFVPDPQSAIHQLGTPVFLNILQFVGVFLSISSFRRESSEQATFKQLLKTGVWTSFVYAITISVFFVGVLYFVGTRWMAVEQAGPALPMKLVALQAFLGLFLGTMLFGLAYSTLIAFALTKRQPKSA